MDVPTPMLCAGIMEVKDNIFALQNVQSKGQLDRQIWYSKWWEGFWKPVEQRDYLCFHLQLQMNLHNAVEVLCFGAILIFSGDILGPPQVHFQWRLQNLTSAKLSLEEIELYL